MKQLFTLLLALAAAPLLHGQTWNGNAGTDWFMPANWTPATVPTATSDVIIPGSRPNYPVLTADVSTKNLTMQSGSALHLNGFNLSGNGALSIQTATIDGGGAFSIAANGSALVENSTITATLTITDITSSFSFYNNTVTGDATLATTSSSTGSSNYMHLNTIVGNLTLTHAGSGNFYEAYNGGRDSITGNATMNVTGSGTFYSGYTTAIKVGGDYTLNRTANGTTNLFASGNQHRVGGNFSFTNTGGATQIGNSSYNTPVGGTFNLSAGAGSFELYRMKNETSGGTVMVTSPGTLYFERDTLKADVSISGSAGYNSFFGNNITGDVDFGTAASNTGGSNYMHGNTIIGNLALTHAGSGAFYEAYNGGRDSITGNAMMNITGTGTFYSGYSTPIKVGGNYTLTRTANGTTNIFYAGVPHSVGGNFSFTNMGGATQIGNSSYNTPVGGIFNLSAGAGSFQLYRMKNETSGGTVSIASPSTLYFQRDTLKANVSILSSTGSNSFYANNILGDVEFETAAANTGSSNFMDANTIIGSLNLTHAGSGSFYEAYNGGRDSITGNAMMSITGTGTFYSGYSTPIKVGGNYTLTRTANGTTNIFYAGVPHSVGGNFSFTNMGGATQIGNSSYNTPVGGTFNLSAGAGSFQLYRMKNETSGGTVTVTSPSTLYFQNDTLKADVTISGIAGYNSFYGNNIQGNLTYTTATGSTTNSNYMDDNTIAGNFALIHRGSGSFYESYNGGPDVVLGTDSLVNAGSGTLIIGYSNPHMAAGNLRFNANAGLSVSSLVLIGSGAANIQNIGSQPLTVANLAINRSSVTPTVLLAPLAISNAFTLSNGYLQSSVTNPLRFNNNVGYTGGSDASHIIGTIERKGTTAFMFPLGNGLFYSPIGISAPGSSAPTFRAQYADSSANSAGYDSSAHDPILNHISNAEYWLLDAVSGGGTVYVTLGWGGNSGGVDAPMDLRVAHWDGMQWLNEGIADLAAYADSGTISSSNPISSFSPFTLASTSGNNPLPLHLISFNAYNLRSGANEVAWRTTQETANTVFEVEKSTDGVYFTSIGRMASQYPNGGSYAVQDDQLETGVNYYRLKAMDATGAYYSKVVRVKSTLPGSSIVISPVPARDNIHVAVQDPALQGNALRVLDLQGRVVYKGIALAETDINTTAWPAGMYLLRIGDAPAIRLVKE